MIGKKYRVNQRGLSLPFPRNFTSRNVAYAVVAISWVVIGVVAYCKFAARTIEQTRAYNLAVLQTLQSDISSLPRVDSILPARTSLNMAYVAQSRTDLASKITNGAYNAHNVPVCFRLYPGAAHASQPKTHNAATGQQAVQLKTSGADLAQLRKFAEYMPLIDLSESLNGSAAPQEHLARTKSGLLTASTYIQNSSLPQNTQLATAIASLANQAPSLTDATKGAWANEVLGQQKAVLVSLAQHDIQATNYAQFLAKAANSYQ